MGIDGSSSGRVLALESSTSRVSCALASDGAVEQSMALEPEPRVSVPFFENLPKWLAGVAPPEWILVGLGPGSYSGLRIGISTAIGLGLGWGVPVLGVPSICGLPGAAGELDVVGDAGRGLLFHARVRGRRWDGSYRLLEPDVMERLSREADLTAIHPLKGFLGIRVETATAGGLLAAWKLGAAQERLEPYYLQPAVEEKKAVART